MFTSILTNTSSGLSVTAVLICLLASLACGIITAFTYRITEHPSKSFLMTAAILPAVVQIVILLVNGNLGAGVAVAGSFSLVRFRSLPGKASDILVIFISMALGLCTGMGYVVLAIVLAVLFSAFLFVLTGTSLLEPGSSYRSLRISIPEDLDYITVFDDIFEKYTKKARIETVKTVNLGTLYQISYEVELKDAGSEKEMLDEIRARNGNLPVISSHAPVQMMEL